MSHKKSIARELVSTALLSSAGTAGLVSAHHYYRRRTNPQARLSDYVFGALGALNFAVKSKRALAKNMVKDALVVNAISNEHVTTWLPRPIAWVSGVAAIPKLVALDDNEAQDFGVVGIDSQRQLVWQTTMPERVHDIVVQPNPTPNQDDAAKRHVVVMGRRPSERFWVLDSASGQVLHSIKAASNRHFYGHACFSLDGQSLYVSENDTADLTGKIGIYDAKNSYQKTGEIDAHGIGPHELIMHPKGEMLIIANGGIKTEQASREELNLDSMKPALTYLERQTGKLLAQITPQHNQMSIRHLDIHHDGTVMIGVQFQGQRHLRLPLVLTHKFGEKTLSPLIMPNDNWHMFHHYIASVAVDSQHNLLCVTSPIGGVAAVFDLTSKKLIDSLSLPDCAGAATVVDDSANFIVSDGQGLLTTISVDLATQSLSSDNKSQRMSFDNHLQEVS